MTINFMDNTVKVLSFGSLLIESPANASEEKFRENVEELLANIYGQIPTWLKFKVGRRFERLGTTYREFLCPAGSVDARIQLHAQQRPGIACSIILRGMRSGKPCCIEISGGVETGFECAELKPF